MARSRVHAAQRRLPSDREFRNRSSRSSLPRADQPCRRSKPKLPYGRTPAAGGSAPEAKWKPQHHHGRRPMSSRLCGFVLPSSALSIGSDRRCWRARSFWPHWADPAPPRPSRVVVPSTRAGEHARGPVQCADHHPTSPGDGDSPRRLFGQSRPNPTHAPSLRTANHFPCTPASLPRQFALVQEIPQDWWERRPGETGGGCRGLADAGSLSCHVQHRRRWGRPKAAELGPHRGRKSRTETASSVGRFLTC
jgi:hypothetical protein